MVSGFANLREEGVRIPPVRGKQRLASMESSVNFRAEKARKRLMPLAFRQWHLYRFDFMVERPQPTMNTLRNWSGHPQAPPQSRPAGCHQL